jgi:glycosyltransferase involved in cell wall biosynthesis
LITKRLSQEGIAHLVGYKSYLEQSTIPSADRLVLHDEHDAPSWPRVREVLAPLMARYHRVILHTHSYYNRPSHFARLVRQHRDARWWTTVHRTPGPGHAPLRWLRGALQAAGIRYPERVYGCSETAAEGLRQHYPPSRVGALVNGRLTESDFRRFEPRTAPRTALLVGRLVAAKGIWIALEAAAIVASRLPGFRLVVVGNGALLEPGQAWVAERGLHHVIEFVGYQVDVQPWYAQADVVWIPTIPEQHAEGLPLVAMEAQGHALPCLYSESGGLPESQVPGVTGLGVVPLNATGLAELTLALLGDDRRYHEMREQIVAHRTRWSIDRMVEDYVAEYLGVLGTDQ